VAHKRLAALSLPSLLSRCRSTLVGYVADESLRGNLPFPRLVIFSVFVSDADSFTRAREAELLYVLKKLFTVRVWPGTLWAALSDDPTKFAVEQPGKLILNPLEKSDLAMNISFAVVDTSSHLVTPTELLADTVKRSPAAILFHLYHSLCEIASIPRRLPTTWTLRNGSHGHHGDNGIQTSFEDVVEVDARRLAKDCLQVLGQEMGVSR